MASVALTPLRGFCLIEPEKEQGVRESGLIDPGAAREKPTKGTVLAVGEPIKTEWGEDPCQVEVGQTVYFHRWSAQDIKDGDKDLALVKFADIMGVYR